MKERPILFSAPMVRAILGGRKTQTRRIAPITDLNIKPYSDDMVTWGVSFSKPVKGVFGSYSGGKLSIDQAQRIIASQFNPYGQPSDRLWVREGFSGPHYQSKCRPSEWSDSDPIWYWADGNPEGGDWTRHKPSIHMPRWASRLLLEVTGVRIERLNDISDADAIAEGVCETGDGAFHVENDRFRAHDTVECYARLFESINGPGSWEANPLVWVIEFKVFEGGAA